MTALKLQDVDLSPEPDLRPIYPTAASISPLLSSDSGLAPSQRSQLVLHCLTRACFFGDLATLTFLLTDTHSQAHVDLAYQDEDGLGLPGITIHGLGSDSDREVEREECVRLLVSQGVDVNHVDNAGWTALHHAALLAPPTLVSYLLTHGCSPFALTLRGLTPLDIITAQETIPGRADVALLLEEAMRSEGWTGGRMEEKRRLLEKQTRLKGERMGVREDITKILDLNPGWWDSDLVDYAPPPGVNNDDEEEDIAVGDELFTPPTDYLSMLVFDPQSLPYVFDSLITNFPPTVGNAVPANMLYMMARFACLACDHTWLEELIVGATDAIEETFFNAPDDIASLLFWLYNTTVLLHLMRCDMPLNEACELLGSYELLTEIINSVYVFIIRFAERRVDQLLDQAILEHVSRPSEVESVQFESDWSFFKTITGRKKAAPPTATAPRNVAETLPSLPSLPVSSSSSVGFQTIKQNIARGRVSAATTPLQTLFTDIPAPPSPEDITSFLTALHALMILSGINPALITQVWSQVIYWTACETFNRILTRKKYLCRSRASQIGLNIAALEGWTNSMALPNGVSSHFAPVRELISWLRNLSSISDFAELIATTQNLRSLNPLQLRRAVREYKYEVNEGRMPEECGQYLAQSQKDWERNRIKMGVDLMRQEQDDERAREREDSENSYQPNRSEAPSPTKSSTTFPDRVGIDILFDRSSGKTHWEPTKAPQVLGELLDSRFMLDLELPTDPRMLAAIPGHILFDQADRHRSSSLSSMIGIEKAAQATDESEVVLAWRCRARKLREVRVDALRWVDGARAASRWAHPFGIEPRHDHEREQQQQNEQEPDYAQEYNPGYVHEPNIEPIPSLTLDIPQFAGDATTRITPIARRPSGRGRQRVGSSSTPIEEY